MSHQAIGIYYKLILSGVAFLINYVSERKGKHRQVCVKNVIGKCCLI